MPIKDLGRALAMSLLVAGSAACAQELEESPIQQTAAVKPAVKKTLVQPKSVKLAGTVTATATQKAPAAPATVAKTSKTGVRQVKQAEVKGNADFQNVPEPTPVPPPPAGEEGTIIHSSVATNGHGSSGSTVKTTKAGPKYGTGRGPYVHERMEFRWQQFKYRWDHYWKPGMQETHWGYPEEFCEKPLGYFNYAHARTMVANAEAARMMLYDCDFVAGEARLNVRGREQLAKHALMLPRNFFPLIIQSDGENPELADARRQLIVSTLTESGFAVPDQRVVVASPIARGLLGAEGESVGNAYYDSYSSGGVNYGFYITYDDLSTGTYGAASGLGSTAGGASTGTGTRRQQ